jgi:hypothetical protein
LGDDFLLHEFVFRPVRASVDNLLRVSIIPTPGNSQKFQLNWGTVTFVVVQKRRV